MIPAWNDLAELWATGMWRASWQGGIAVVIAWAVHRWFRLSPRVVCWVWRLACLKLLVALCWSQPVELALLPARVQEAAIRVPMPQLRIDLAEEPNVQAPDFVQPPPQLEPPAIAISTSALILSIWLIGVAFCVYRSTRQWHVARRLLHAEEVEQNSLLLRLCIEEGERLGIHRTPQLRRTSHVASPVLIGVWRPSIIVPAQAEKVFDEPELRMMLAHELAHLKRYDLAWNWLPTLVTWLFYFNPLVWLMVRRWSEAQEAACDELVIQRQAAQSAAYGRLLFKLSTLASSDAKPGFTTAGVLGTYRNLERRIVALTFVRPLSIRRLMIAACVLLLTGMITTVPWRLVAQETAEAKQELALSSANVDDRQIATFTADEPRNNSSSDNEDAGSTTTKAAIARLRELGANIDSGPGNAFKGAVSIGIDIGFKGTGADLVKLLAEVPIRALYIDLADAKSRRQEIEKLVKEKKANPKLLDMTFRTIDAEAIGALELKRPLAYLGLEHASDGAMAKISNLPQCQQLLLLRPSLSADGWKNFAKLANGLQSLQIDGEFYPGAEQVVNDPINDSAMETVATINSLTSLNIFHASISDKGVANLATLKNLKTFGLGRCRSVRGAGIASLAQLSSLQKLTLSGVPIDGKGLEAIGKLTHLKSLILVAGEFDASDVEALANLSDLRTLVVTQELPNKGTPTNSALGDAILRAVGSLAKLKTITLQGITIGDEGFMALSAASALQRLMIGPVQLTDRGLKAIGTLHGIRTLSIFGEGLTDDGLRHFAGLESLEELFLQESAITGTGITALAPLNKLKTLGISSSPLDDEGCRAFSSLPSIEHLSLSQTKLTDQAIASIAKLPNLQTLALSESAITTSGLMGLHEHKKLRELSVIGMKASKEDIVKLRAALPSVKIVSNRNNWVTSRLDDGSESDVETDSTSTNRDQSQSEPETPEEKLASGAGTEEETPNGGSLTFTVDPAAYEKQAAKPDPAAQRALSRLKELGAIPATLKQIGIQGGWKGTDADLRLVNDLPDLDWLYLDLEEHIGVEALEGLKGQHPLNNLALANLSDAMLAEVTRLPPCNRLTILQYKISDEGWQRFAQLVDGVKILELNGAAGPVGINDNGLKQISLIRSLTGLQIFNGSITDDGLRHLTSLDKLADLNLSNCAKVRGSGYAHLAANKSLRRLSAFPIRIDSDNLQALANLSQLESISLQTDFPATELAPKDFGPLKDLSNLRSMTITNVGPRVKEVLGNAVLAAAGHMQSLSSLRIYGLEMNVDGVDALVKAPRIQELYLDSVELHEQTLAALGRLKDLRKLGLGSVGVVGDAALQKLVAFEQLTQVSLTGSGLSDDGLAQFASLHALEILNLPDSKITGTGLGGLANLKQLRTLTLSDSPFNDQGCQLLRRLPALEWLHLGKTVITDQGLNAIGMLPNLRMLNLDDTKVTIDGLMKLSALKRLSYVSAVGVKATDADMSRLHAALPTVQFAMTPPPAGITGYVFVADGAVAGGDDESGQAGETKEGSSKEAPPQDQGRSPDKKDRGGGGALTFTPDPVPTNATTVEVTETDTPTEAAASGPTRALKRLKELGASPANLKHIGIDLAWKGTDADLRLINELPNLELLHLDFEKQVGANGLKQFKFEHRIRYLTLDALSDEVLEKISRLPPCQILALGRYKISDDGFSRLAELAEGIERLEIMSPYDPDGSITNQGLRSVARIRSLKSLQFFDAGFSDDGLEVLGGLPNLERLSLSQCWRIRGTGYASLTAVKSLRTLDAYAMQVGDAAVNGLAKLTQLSALSLQPFEKLSEESIERLRSALPNTKVTTFDYEDRFANFVVIEGDSGNTEKINVAETPASAELRAQALSNEAQKWLARKEYSRAKSDYERALLLFPSTGILRSLTSCNLAWLLATCPDDSVRDGAKAVELATSACEGLGWKGRHAAEAIDTLAAASAEAGDYAAAVKWQEKAMGLAAENEQFQKGAKERLSLYRQHKPYREPVASP